MDISGTNRVKYSQDADTWKRSFGTLAAIFNKSPDSALVHNLLSLGANFFFQLYPGDGLNIEIKEGLSEITHFVENNKAQSEKVVEQSLQVDWTRLFRGIQPGYGPEPPYEEVYLGEGESNFQVLEAVAGFYVQYGVSIAKNADNRPDYIGLEMDFMRYLCEQEVAAWKKGEKTQIQKWQIAEHDFLTDHLGRWVPSFCDRAIEEAKTDFYRGFVHLTKGTIEEMINAQRPNPFSKDQVRNGGNHE
jgi:TorA maturation chaperone TorD